MWLDKQDCNLNDRDKAIKKTINAKTKVSYQPLLRTYEINAYYFRGHWLFKTIKPVKETKKTEDLEKNKSLQNSLTNIIG